MAKFKSLIIITIITLAMGLFVIDKNVLAQDANTKLLLHADGANNSTSFTDSSNNVHNVTAYGNAKNSTSAKKFGTASAYFDGSGDYLGIPDSADFDFGSDDFTIDTWVYFSSVAASGAIASQYDYTGTKSFNLYWSSSNNVVFQYSTDGSTNANVWQCPWTPSTGQWYHVAVIRNGVDYKVFVDGTQIGSTENMSTDTLYNYGSDFMIGAAIQGGLPVDQLNGYLDELRITKGVAWWTSNFTPPTAPYSGGNEAPVLDPIADITANVGDAVTFNPTATDPDGDNLTYTYSGWMSSSSYVTSIGDAGTHTVTVTVSDGALTDSQVVTITVAASSGGDGNSLDAADGDPTDAVYVDNEGNVGIGTTNPGTYKLAVNGTIKTKEVVVDISGWSDFVFNDHYSLMPLWQLERYIANNKHLPQLPSAEEVAEKGVSVGDMQSRLLQKIEELTLYMIDMRKESEVFKKMSEKFEQENEALRNKTDMLEREMVYLKGKMNQ